MKEISKANSPIEDSKEKEDVPDWANPSESKQSHESVQPLMVNLPTRIKKTTKRRRIQRSFDDTGLSSSAQNARKLEQERLDRLAKLKGLEKESFLKNVLPLVEESSSKKSEDDVSNEQIPSIFSPIDIIELSSDEEEIIAEVKRKNPFMDQQQQNLSRDASSQFKKMGKLSSRKRRKSGDLESTELSDGRLLVNANKPPYDPDVYFPAHLISVLKPHQLGGIRFMFDNIIESVSEFTKSAGLGCILAHSMGLGKTIQVVAFTDIFFRATKSKNILIIVPINTLLNWNAEYDKWLPDKLNENCQPIRAFKVWLFGDGVKSFKLRSKLIEDWYREGGVLLIGYDMFRMLVNKGTLKRKRASKKKAAADVDSEQELDFEKIQQALVDPGPDLVICDEGHRIKNEKSNTFACLNSIKTRRRIVLTGYPLQNNLMEYYCMVDFVRPYFLGTKKEFIIMFEKPIKNGLCMDSTQNDLKLARQRTHVLVEMLKGFVQRRTHHILKSILPPSYEYVIFLRKSPVQRMLYRSFLESARKEISCSGLAVFNPLKAYAACSKIWNHPDILYQVVSKQLDMISQSADEIVVKEQYETNVNSQSVGVTDLSKNNFSNLLPLQTDFLLSSSHNTAEESCLPFEHDLKHSSAFPTFPVKKEYNMVSDPRLTQFYPTFPPPMFSSGLSGTSFPIKLENQMEHQPEQYRQSYLAFNPSFSNRNPMISCAPYGQTDMKMGTDWRNSLLFPQVPERLLYDSNPSVPLFLHHSHSLDYNDDCRVSNVQSHNISDSSLIASKEEPSLQHLESLSNGCRKSNMKELLEELKLDSTIKYDWARETLANYEENKIENGYKMLIALALIQLAVSLGEKVLLFSQSLLTLNLIENFLAVDEVLSQSNEKKHWVRNKNYFRYDGSTPASDRERLINRFNEDRDISLFLISTKAGSLGINLVSANRVIIFDASWNPCHDAQAVCRIYRYGQTKRTYIYRLVVDNCLERGIFNRQIGKSGLQQRVVDDRQTDIDVTKRELEHLLIYDEGIDLKPVNWDTGSWNLEDPLLQTVALKYPNVFSQVPFLQESLLMQREDGLSEEEKLEAKLLYESEKKSYLGRDFDDDVFWGVREMTSEKLAISQNRSPPSSLTPMEMSLHRLYNECRLNTTFHRAEKKIANSLLSQAPTTNAFNASQAPRRTVLDEIDLCESD